MIAIARQLNAAVAAVQGDDGEVYDGGSEPPEESHRIMRIVGETGAVLEHVF